VPDDLEHVKHVDQVNEHVRATVGEPVGGLFASIDDALLPFPLIYQPVGGPISARWLLSWFVPRVP
jgi:hypothetical protein